VGSPVSVDRADSKGLRARRRSLCRSPSRRRQIRLYRRAALRAGIVIRLFLTAEGRRAMALILLAGGGVAMTAYPAVSPWPVRHVASYAFWLGLAALALVAIVLTGFAGLLVRRTVKVGRDGLEISDSVVSEADVIESLLEKAKARGVE